MSRINKSCESLPNKGIVHTVSVLSLLWVQIWVHGPWCYLRAWSCVLALPLCPAGIFIPFPNLSACACEQESFQPSILFCAMPSRSGSSALNSRVLCTRMLTVKLAVLLWCRGFLQAPTRQMALSVHSHSPLHCNWEEMHTEISHYLY